MLVARIRAIVDCGSLVECTKRKLRGHLVMWEKPSYEIVETCCEISAYVYTK